MALEVHYRHDETLQSLSARDDDDNRDVHVQNSSMISLPLRDTTNARDSSQTRRDCGDDTRQSIQQSFQTNRSILNCTSEGETEDEEEEQEEPGSFLFDEEDFHSPLNQSLVEQEGVEVELSYVDVTSTPIADHKCKVACCVNDKQWWLDTSLQNVTDSFVSFCSSRPDEACGNFIDVVVTDKCSQKLRRQVQTDLLHLLGCDAPGDRWSLPLLGGPKMKHSQPVRRTPRQRAEHIRRIRHDLIREKTDLLPNLASARSFQQLEWDIDPIKQGYDSDPEEVFPSSPIETHNEDTLMDTSLLDEDDAEDYHFFDSHREKVAQEYQLKTQYEEPRNDDDREIYETVQESLNYTWTLTWHDEGNPMLIQFWIERGTMLNLGSTVVEPKFMWRQVYQPSLTSKRTLSESATKPMQLRVLNVCHIFEVPSKNLDRNKYPMARTACSFFIKTCRDQCFLFEASSPQEKDQMVRSWKLVVARLASLAITEDMEAMANEFFTPSVTWQMLTTHDA